MGLFLIILAIVILLIIMYEIGFMTTLFFVLIIALVYLGVRYLFQRIVVMR